MIIAEYLGFGIAFCGCIGLVWKTASNAKTKVSYRSFDRQKEDNKATFVTKEVCEIKSSNLDKQLEGIHSKLDRLLFKNGAR